MKKTLLLTAGILFLFSCTKEQPVESIEQDGTTFTKLSATIDDQQTKTHLGSNCISVLWTANDKLDVITGKTTSTSTSPTTYTLDSGENTSSGVFTGAPVTIVDNVIYAFYPGTEYNYYYSTGAVYQLPSAQKYVAGGLQDGILPMMGRGTSPSAMMFTYGAGIIRVKLYDTAGEVKIKSLRLETDINCCGKMYYTLGNASYPTGSNESGVQTATGISIDFSDETEDCVALGSTSGTATEFNLVVWARSYGYIRIIATDEDDNEMALMKSSLTVANGKIYDFAATQFGATPLSPVSLEFFDGSTSLGTVNLNSISSTTAPFSTFDKIVVTSSESVVAESKLALLSSCIAKWKQNVTLDLSAISLPDNKLTNVPFANKPYIIGLITPSTLQTLGSQCISTCSSLTSLTLNEGLTTVEDFGFYKGTSTVGVSVNIPASLTKWGYYNNAGTSFTVASGNTTFSASSDGKCLLSKDGTKLYSYACKCADTEYTIPGGVTTVQGFSFYVASNLTKITLPSTLVTLQTNAFARVDNLATLDATAVADPSSTIVYRLCSSSSTYPGKSVTGEKIVRVASGMINDFITHDSPASYGWKQWIDLNYKFYDGSSYMPASSMTIGEIGENNPSITW